MQNNSNALSPLLIILHCIAVLFGASISLYLLYQKKYNQTQENSSAIKWEFTKHFSQLWLFEETGNSTIN